MNDIICNRCEDMNLLIPYINKPVYVKGYCWGKSFDGWVVIYQCEKTKSVINPMNLVFDYHGLTFSVFGFLPSRYTMCTDSLYNNAIYYTEQINK